MCVCYTVELSSQRRERGENGSCMRWFDWWLFKDSRVYVMVFLGLKVLEKACIPMCKLSSCSSPNGRELFYDSLCLFISGLDVTLILILWFAEVLCGHFSPAQTSRVRQSFSCVFSLQRDPPGSQRHSSLWGAETFHKAERHESGWKSESLLSEHCCKQVTAGLKYWKTVT